MYKILSSLTITWCLLHFCEPYKLLIVFPIPGKSHSILGNAFVNHLLNSGHQVSYITPIPMTPRPGLRQINVESNFNYFVSDEELNIQKLMTKEIDMKDMTTLFTLMFKISNATVLHENVQMLLHDNSEKFDAVIAEWMYSELYSGFSAVFNCPLIWFLSVSPHSMALSLIDDISNPAFTADHVRSNSIPPFTFLERVNELATLIRWKFNRWWVKSRDCKSYNQAFESAILKRNLVYLPLDEAKYNGSLMFVNSHVSTSDAITIPRNVIEIGGYHINNTVEPLPEDLRMIMDQSKHGVILFSMGSMLKSTKLPDKIKKEIIKFINVNRAVAKGFAKRVDLNDNTPVNLKIAIDEIISSPKYRERIGELSFIYHDRALSPEAEIVRWIHHVVRTGGATHLRSPAILMHCKRPQMRRPCGTRDILDPIYEFRSRW
ncbi:unnamed protein product, partial [Iphiclides podalirius]